MQTSPPKRAGLFAAVLMAMVGCHNVLGLDGLQKVQRDDDDDGSGAGDPGSGGQGGMPTTVTVAQGAGPSSCGDGFIDPSTESCDDGGNANGDGCSSDCFRESGWCCASEPSQCTQGPFIIKTFDAPIMIPDAGYPNNIACMFADFPQGDCGPVVDIDVRVIADHVFIGDLVMFARNPYQDTAIILDTPGINEPDSSDLWPDAPILFDDEASVPSDVMGADCDDFEAVCLEGMNICNYYPYPEPLAFISPPDPVGTWEFCVGDDSSNDIGWLLGAEFIITTD